MSDIHNMTTEELAKTIAFHTSYSGSHVVNSHLHELTRRLEAAESKAATYWAECEAWRNQAGVWLIVDGKKHWYIQDGNTLFEITEAAATDEARGGAE